MVSYSDLLTQLRNDQSNQVDLIKFIHDNTKLPFNIIKKGLAEGILTVDNKVIKATHVNISNGVEIKWQKQVIKYEVKEITFFDRFISLLLKKNFPNQAINSFSLDSKILFYSFVVEFFFQRSYNGVELSKSTHSHSVINGFEEFCRNYFTSFNEVKTLKKKELVEQIIYLRESSYQNLQKIINSTVTKLYTKPAQSHNDFLHLFKEKGFILLIRPYFNVDYDFQLIIEKLIKEYRTVIEAETQSEKITKRSLAIDAFDSIHENFFKGRNDRVSKEFLKLIWFFKAQCNSVLGIKDSGKAVINFSSEERTYNFQQSSLFIYASLENTGNGIAKNIQIENISKKMEFENQELTDILPANERRKVKFQINRPLDTNQTSLSFKIKWENESKQTEYLTVKDFQIKSQDDNLPWDILRRSNPYNSSQIVDDPEKLFGREQLIDDLRWNIERNNFISSFILYGQKRVGKSSIVKTLETIYRNDPNVIFVYKTMFDVKDHIDPNRTFQRIGEVYSLKILNEFQRKCKKELKEQLIIPRQNFTGSLAPLTDLIDQIHMLCESLRFIIVIDEFDELNKEFFDTGELAKTFALSIGKGLNEKNYIGIILVGSENMIHKASQGMRLNTFQVKKIDTFDKEKEFESYCKIILEPSKSCLSFDVEVLNLLYDYTNGNPYFTNLLAHKIFLDAFERKISYIDYEYAQSIITHQIPLMSNNDFEHFWADSLSEKAIHYEKILDRRKRLLTAFATTKHEARPLTWMEIKRKIRYTNKFEITEDQMEDTLNEFKERGIIKLNKDSTLKIQPNLFEEWLFTSGYYHVIAQLHDKDEILDKVKQDQKLRLLPEELVLIVNHLGEYSPKLVTSLNRFLDQFEENSDKRIITDLLKKFVVITHEEIIDHLKRIRKLIWGEIHLNLSESDIRTDSEIVCFKNTYEQNKSILQLMKEIFKFSHNKAVKFDSQLDVITSDVKNLIIYEPLIDCPFFYRNELSKLFKSINPLLANDLKIYIVCFIITDEAKVTIEELINTHFLFTVNIHAVRITQRSEIAPFINVDNTVNDSGWKLLSEIEPTLDESSCLVKIGEIVPYQNIPVFWNTEQKKINPLFNSPLSKSVYDRKVTFSKTLRKLKFQSESNKLELKASLTEPTFNWKKIKGLVAQMINLAGNEELVSRNRNEVLNLWKLKYTNIEKETLRKYVKHSLMKNLVAFANTKGGDIYVGIEDDFTVPGIIQDRIQYITNEGIRKVFDNLVTEYIGKEYAELFDLEFITLPNDTIVLKISVSKADQENGIWLKVNDKGVKLQSNAEEFYVRGQQESNLLTAKEVSNWKNNR